ncbi:ABC-type multidrug transport system [Eupransor demetentiae]|uniref:ATPase component (CcmA) n=2 Tax=Eupransor demetentiae TaxID=3109584 RepID=A0ABP0ERC3_9LACO|nr:ABC-type multidrug transport system [Lactobacillaceae bacterium LMG 33000]
MFFMGLIINNLSGGYAGNNVLRNISFEVPAGKIVALIGLNGAGKSTTIKHIIGERLPYTGSITLDGVDITKDPTDFKNQLAYIPEQPILYDELTLEEHLHLMLASHHLDNAAHWKRAMELLGFFHLEDKLHWLPVNLSKGMRQKIMIVAAFMLDRDLIIIDEPFIGLDSPSQRDLIHLIKEQKEAGRSVLVTTHLLSAAKHFVDDFVVLQDGKIEFIGSPVEMAESHGLTMDTLDNFFDIARGDRDDL